MKLSAQSIRDRLSTGGNWRDGYTVCFDGVALGRYVSFGRGGNRGNVGTRTVYASRIYIQKASIEEEAASTRSLLNKVASALAKAHREGRWQPGAATPAQP